MLISFYLYFAPSFRVTSKFDGQNINKIIIYISYVWSHGNVAFCSENKGATYLLTMCCTIGKRVEMEKKTKRKCRIMDGGILSGSHFLLWSFCISYLYYNYRV
jgi:hypothetical protein